MKIPSRSALAALVLACVLVGCGDEQQGGGAAEGSPPPVAVSVVTVKAEAIPLRRELPGRIAPTRIAEVLPRVSGLIQERVFEQGSIVQAGDVLYRLDPEPFRVEVASAEAALERAEAALVRARQEAERQRELRRRSVASEQNLENAVTALAQAEAEVKMAKANLAAARLNLHYSEVRAPITGRIGRAHITEGALVSPQNGESLATIQQLDPVYADFTQSAGELLKLKQSLEAGELESAAPGEATVRLLLDDGSLYPLPGRLLFSEASVDATTGQITLRAEFPNPDDVLLPGLYVRVVVEQGIQQGVLAVPQQAVQRDFSGRPQLYVVKEDGTVELRPVQTGRVVEDRWVIDEGLSAGERVVVEGFQKIQPGATVTAQAWREDADVPDGRAPETSGAGSAG